MCGARRRRTSNHHPRGQQGMRIRRGPCGLDWACATQIEPERLPRSGPLGRTLAIAVPPLIYGPGRRILSPAHRTCPSTRTPPPRTHQGSTFTRRGSTTVGASSGSGQGGTVGRSCDGVVALLSLRHAGDLRGGREGVGRPGRREGMAGRREEHISTILNG
jgi:hypothetical protein